MSAQKQSVIATYHVSETFYVPDGIDLKNTEQVKEWYVRWNVLHIILNSNPEKEIIVNGENMVDDIDQFKYAISTEIQYESQEEYEKRH